MLHLQQVEVLIVHSIFILPAIPFFPGIFIFPMNPPGYSYETPTNQLEISIQH
jgi:hypothetical protein